MVLPSYREGTPRSLLEGAAMGRPIIAADVTGCREIVVKGINGFLFKSKNYKSHKKIIESIKETCDEFNIPTKQITIEYNQEKIYYYE